jgi:hypothetical protein
VVLNDKGFSETGSSRDYEATELKQLEGSLNIYSLVFTLIAVRAQLKYEPQTP